MNHKLTALFSLLIIIAGVCVGYLLFLRNKNSYEDFKNENISSITSTPMDENVNVKSDPADFIPDNDTYSAVRAFAQNEYDSIASDIVLTLETGNVKCYTIVFEDGKSGTVYDRDGELSFELDPEDLGLTGG